mmetsp:Transcript_10081/g.19269  ORF Transcript_10081/g.19269 Transcript_10081/m.19269 type:complete len:211 (+) Transcript_10081:548-1180(+)
MPDPSCLLRCSSSHCSIFWYPFFFFGVAESSSPPDDDDPWISSRAARALAAAAPSSGCDPGLFALTNASNVSGSFAASLSRSKYDGSVSHGESSRAECRIPRDRSSDVVDAGDARFDAEAEKDGDDGWNAAEEEVAKAAAAAATEKMTTCGRGIVSRSSVGRCQCLSLLDGFDRRLSAQARVLRSRCGRRSFANGHQKTQTTLRNGERST